MGGFLYTGEQQDADTGLYYLRARYYQPNVGRFTSRDPFDGLHADPITLHKYLYAGANPVMHIDPSGRNYDAVSFTLSAAMMAALYAATVTAMVYCAYRAAEALVAGAPAAKDQILELLASGREGAAALAGILSAHISEYTNAINNAMRNAVKAIGRSLRQLKKLRPFPVIRSRTPKIYSFNVAALATNPTWFVLTYLGAGNPARAINRGAVWARWSYLMATAPPGYQLDEFPYACTVEGGMPLALGMPVPAAENSRQGGDLGAFCRWVLRGRRSQFLVVPVPI